MSSVPASQARFLEALCMIATSDRSAAELTADLRKALLDYASETPDNCAAAERIEVGAVSATLGPKVVGQPLLLSDIAHALEELPLPDALKQCFPAMSEADWQAFTRITTLIHTLLNRPSSPAR